MTFFEPTMESLPEEMIEQISKHLQASDLASCCAVSRSWREVFGGDRLWRVHCDESLPQYLDESSCMVDPHFSSLEPEDTTLSAIGVWRLNFMKETRLKNNWSSGNYIMIQRPWLINEREFVKSIFFQDRYILVFLRSELQVWDVNKKPALKSSFSFDANHKGFKVFEVKGGDKFVAFNALVIRVYSLHIETNKLELVHVFSIEMSEKCSENTEEAAQSLLIEEDNVIVRHAIVGSVFVGITTHLTSNKINIWNFETGQKLKQEDIPFSGHKRTWGPIQACEQTKDIVLKREELGDGKRIAHWYVYSLSKLEFLPFHHEQTHFDYLLKPHYEYIIFDKYVALRVDSYFYVYNYLTCELLYTKWGEGFTLLPFRNFIVYGQKIGMYLLDPNNLNPEKAYDIIDKNTINENVAVGSLGIMLRRAVWLYSCVHSTSTFKYTSMTFKDIGLRVPLCKVTSKWPCLINQTGTKLVLMDLDRITKLTVVHFW